LIIRSQLTSKGLTTASVFKAADFLRRLPCRQVAVPAIAPGKTVPQEGSVAASGHVRKSGSVCPDIVDSPFDHVKPKVADWGYSSTVNRRRKT
jgi:hypothetical protein